MAASSLFHASLDDLKASARLSELPTTGDPNAIFELALAKAQSELFLSLGQATITQYQGVADVCPPTTEDQAKRGLLKAAETDLLLIELICRLPYGTIDGSAGGYEIFDKEAPFRLMTPEELVMLSSKLRKSVDKAIVGVGGESTESPFTAISYGNVCRPKNIFHKGPSHRHYAPGPSSWPYYDHCR